MPDAESKLPEIAETLTGEALRAYTPRLHMYVLRSFCRRPDDISDVIQETFLRFLRKRDRTEVIRNPLAYLCKIASGVVAETYEHESRDIVTCDSDIVDAAADSLTFADTDDFVRQIGMREALLQAIAQLPEAYRQVLLGVEAQDMTCKEVARATGYAPATVKQYLCAARARLRQLLEDRWSKEDLR